MAKILTYTGKKQPQPRETKKLGHTDLEVSLYPYYPEEALIEAVNLALILKRPLLVKGQPGSGKTRLALAVAYELGWPYFEWHVKSTDRARDGLYTYDAVRRLHDAQLVKTDSTLTLDLAIKNYIALGPLGEALELGQKGQRAVVLIDEIDKADLDFPNDLLLELDQLRFTIRETKQEVKVQAGSEPLIFITSNDEKDLPEAFLRRCLYHYLDFPDEIRLKAIITGRFPHTPAAAVIEVAVERFIKLRDELERDISQRSKQISTAELIDWFAALHHYVGQGQITVEELQTTLPQNGLPYASALLKSMEIYSHYLKSQANELTHV